MSRWSAAPPGEARGIERRGAWVLVVADAIKPPSADAIQQLRLLGLRPVLLTGDTGLSRPAVAAAVWGIDADAVIAEVLPPTRSTRSNGIP